MPMANKSISVEAKVEVLRGHVIWWLTPEDLEVLMGQGSVVREAFAESQTNAWKCLQDMAEAEYPRRVWLAGPKDSVADVLEFPWAVPDVSFFKAFLVNHCSGLAIKRDTTTMEALIHLPGIMTDSELTVVYQNSYAEPADFEALDQSVLKHVNSSRFVPVEKRHQDPKTGGAQVMVRIDPDRPKPAAPVKNVVTTTLTLLGSIEAKERRIIWWLTQEDVAFLVAQEEGLREVFGPRSEIGENVRVQLQAMHEQQWIGDSELKVVDTNMTAPLNLEVGDPKFESVFISFLKERCGGIVIPRSDAMIKVVSQSLPGVVTDFHLKRLL